jgi:hypothetical protein
MRAREFINEESNNIISQVANSADKAIAGSSETLEQVQERCNAIFEKVKSAAEQVIADQSKSQYPKDTKSQADTLQRFRQAMSGCSITVSRMWLPVWKDGDVRFRGTYAKTSERKIYVRYSDAGGMPDNALTWMIGHEYGHLIDELFWGYTKTNPGQFENFADYLGTLISKKLGITSAGVFSYLMRDKKQRYDYEMNPNAQRPADDPHATVYQRRQAAKALGFDLSKAPEQNPDQSATA